MAGRLSSPRFRRKVAWLGGATCLAGVIVIGSILIGNTGHSTATKLIDKPAQVYHEPARMSLSPADRRQVFDAAARFIQTAVARKHLDWQTCATAFVDGVRAALE